MSISGALNNAMSGLRATSRATQVISDNISNALTPGYGVRSLELSNRAVDSSGGVTVTGISRQSDPQLIADRRQAVAQENVISAKANFLDRYEGIIGTADQPGSLSGRLTDFENALISASSRPDALERLEVVSQTASYLVDNLNQASYELQTMRTEADRAIEIEVERLNGLLKDLEDLNTTIVEFGVIGRDVSGLLDEQHRILDEVSSMVPVRVMPRDNGQISLFSYGGAVLLEGRAATIEFASSGRITPYMSLAGGQLSGLTINGYPADVSVEGGALRGGTLGSHFEIRDKLAVDAQMQLDAVARDLIERFSDPSVDSTLGATDPGIFTDLGIALDPLNELGISERLRLNSSIDLSQAGEVWRLRDGLGAATQGDPGNASTIVNYADALATRTTPASGVFGTGLFSMLELVTSLQSQIGADRLLADTDLSYATAQTYELTQLELSQGVDTDAELQDLLLVEQAYAANARIIQAADDMLEQLLRI